MEMFAHLKGDLLLRVAHSFSEEIMVLITLPLALLMITVAMLLVGVYYELDTDLHPQYHGMR